MNPEPETLTFTYPNMDAGPILIHEVRKELQKAKSGKATGFDELPCQV